MQRIERWEILLALGVFLFFSLYIYHHIDFEDLLRPQPATPVHIKGKIAPSRKLKDVKIVSIPDEVYESIKQNSAAAKYLQGNEKYVLMMYTRGCPYARAFKNAFSKLFATNAYRPYYRKHIFELWGSTWISCNTATCPKLWIFENCGQGICIINPKLRKAVIDNSQDASQIELLLEKYKEW